jgi:hypothetical protein
VFTPALPEKVEAAAGLPLGLADKLFLALSDADEFEKDNRVFGRTDRSATGVYHFRPFGRPQIEAYFGGAFAAELEKHGNEDTNCYGLKGKDLGTDAPGATVTKLLPVIRPGLGARWQLSRACRQVIKGPNAGLTLLGPGGTYREHYVAISPRGQTSRCGP